MSAKNKQPAREPERDARAVQEPAKAERAAKRPTEEPGNDQRPAEESAKAEQAAKAIRAYRCPRYAQLPEIPLYRDQVLDALERYTAPFFAGRGEPPLTAAMINNYVKLQLLPPPEKKRYSRGQLARLYVICLLKQVMSISELRGLMAIQRRSYPLEQAYDYFCTELEKALQATFGTRDFSMPSSAQKTTPESELVRSLALCLANKMFALKFIEQDFGGQDPGEKKAQAAPPQDEAF